MSWSKDRLKNLRKRLGWLRGDMARRLSVKVDKIYAWEAGEESISPEVFSHLDYLASRLEVLAEHISEEPAADTHMENYQKDQVQHKDIK